MSRTDRHLALSSIAKREARATATDEPYALPANSDTGSPRTVHVQKRQADDEKKTSHREAGRIDESLSQSIGAYKHEESIVFLKLQNHL